MSIYIRVYMCMYIHMCTWKHAYHEYMHINIYTSILSNILFPLRVFVKPIWVPIFRQPMLSFHQDLYAFTKKKRVTQSF